MSTDACPSPTAAPSAATPATIARRHPRMLWGALALHVLAALAGLAAPRLLGDLVEAVEQGTTVGHVDRIVAAAGRVPACCRRC